jgi:hypothetical protein
VAAGTVTTTEIVHTTLRKVVFAWTSGTGAEGGTASGATTAALDGMVIGLTTIPSGAAAPTDDYDITVTDGQGHDVLLGAGADRDAVNTEHVSTGMAGVAGSVLTLNITNAGDAKQGTVILWIR